MELARHGCVESAPGPPSGFRRTTRRIAGDARAENGQQPTAHMRHVDPNSIIPPSPATVHLVVEDFGVLGRAYRETDTAHADAATTIEKMLRGEYSAPVQVIALNVENGWARDVSAQIARALVAKTGLDGMPEHVRCFVERHIVCLAC
jgi:hypothetical protein